MLAYSYKYDKLYDRLLFLSPSLSFVFWHLKGNISGFGRTASKLGKSAPARSRVGSGCVSRVGSRNFSSVHGSTNNRFRGTGT